MGPVQQCDPVGEALLSRLRGIPGFALARACAYPAMAEASTAYTLAAPACIHEVSCWPAGGWQPRPDTGMGKDSQPRACRD